MITCVLCNAKIDENRESYAHKACKHHLCVACDRRMVLAGKGVCMSCPLPRRPDAATNTLGALVLGNDVEQNKRIASALRAERHVSPLPPVQHTSTNEGAFPPASIATPTEQVTQGCAVH